MISEELQEIRRLRNCTFKIFERTNDFPFLASLALFFSCTAVVLAMVTII